MGAQPVAADRVGSWLLFEAVLHGHRSLTCTPRRGSMASAREPERNHTGPYPNHVRNSVCFPGTTHRANTTCASGEPRSDFATFTYGESDHPDPRWLLLREVLDYDWKQEYVHGSQGSIAPDAPPQFSPVPEGEGWEPYGKPMQGKPWYGKVQIFLRHTGKTMAKAVGSFYTDSLARLQTDGDPEDVRIVPSYEY